MRRRAKTHKVGRRAIEDLMLIIEERVKEEGRYDDWLRHIGSPGNKGLDDNYLVTDYDWPLRMVVWYLEGC